MAQRKMVEERKRYYGELEGSLRSVIADLEAEIAEYGEDVRLERVNEQEYGFCDCGVEVFYLVFEREETDAEMNKRIRQSEAQKARRAREKEKREAKERKELARLQKKYGEG